MTHIALGLDTTSRVYQLALLAGDDVLAERRVEKEGAGDALLAELSCLLTDAAIKLEAVTLIAVCRGPGSFTGLRVGISTASGLGKAMGCKVVAVPLFWASALLFSPEETAVVPYRTAAGEDVFCQVFKNEAEAGFVAVSEVLLAKRSELPLDFAAPASSARNKALALDIDQALQTRSLAVLLAKAGQQERFCRASSLELLYGRPLNAKTLVERGKVMPRPPLILS